MICPLDAVCMCMCKRGKTCMSFAVLITMVVLRTVMYAALKYPLNLCTRPVHVFAILAALLNGTLHEEMEDMDLEIFHHAAQDSLNHR